MQEPHDIEFHDNSAWFRSIGASSDYYYSFLLHFVAHGVLFERFILDPSEDMREYAFTTIHVMPVIEKIANRFDLKPLIVRLCPEQQNDEEDFFWWCYPPHVNDFIVAYAKKHNLQFKKVILGR